MSTSILKAFETGGMSSTTSLVVWSMIIFLVILIGGLSFALIKQMQMRSDKKGLHPIPKKPKGF